MRNLKQLVATILRRVFRMRVSYQYGKQYKKLLRRNAIASSKIPSEDCWMQKWSVLGSPNPVYYRLFSHYVGEDLNIIPEDICRTVVEPILDPAPYVPYYSDKNIFDKLFKEGTLAKTILRKMNGMYCDASYQKVELDDAALALLLGKSGCRKIVIKPSVDGESGRGVKLFRYAQKQWREIGGDAPLTVAFLEANYGADFIIQECLEQHEGLAYFNPTSVNTLRLSLYRSVKTNECAVTRAIIRIGGKDALVDNAHAGGGYVGINPDGSLCHRVLNQYGASCTEFNDIDFTQQHTIPHWDRVVDFAKYIGANVPHHRLLALDIMLDKAGNPHLIEFNCKAYSMWLFQFTTGGALGDYTDEIIEYCCANRDKQHFQLTL